MRPFVFALAWLVALSSCARSPRVENHSFARPGGAVMKHLDLDLKLDFDRERITGSAKIRIANPRGAKKLYLDTRDLDIRRVTIGDPGRETKFRLGEASPYLGRPLIIDIEPATRVVTVFYETTEGATAVDWLEPAHTTGGKMPFLYTQGQSILNRTWIPCQDHPGIRVTYNARIQVPPGMMAVMSARNGTRKNPDGIYQFSMPQPIPPYLIALAAGDLEFRPISERCGVYAEPEVIDRAAWEFADTESMMQRAEALYGPYRWERYDIIVLPPSFPFGGMENPRLSFVTPVLLAGDRSLVSTIAHELAHSWSGNLVTNATWDDFWLNEGFTTYFERRIVEMVYGTEFMEMQALLGLAELQEAIASLGADHPNTRLSGDTSGRDPDETISTLVYEKGYLFLRLIEETVGREEWDAFLRGYFDRFAFQTMTSRRFVNYLRGQLVKGDAALEDALRIDEWVYGTGLPDNCPEVRSTAFEKVEAAVVSWQAGTPAGELDTAGWSTQEWKQFIQRLPDPMTTAQMSELDAAFDFTNRSNGEILQVWFLHAIANDYEAAYPQIERFLVGIGRIWLISALYREFAETPEGLERARAIYDKARVGYHPLTVSIIDRILAERG